MKRSVGFELIAQNYQLDPVNLVAIASHSETLNSDLLSSMCPAAYREPGTIDRRVGWPAAPTVSTTAHSHKI